MYRYSDGTYGILTGLLVAITVYTKSYRKLCRKITTDRVALLIAWHSVVAMLFKDSVILAITF